MKAKRLPSGNYRAQLYAGKDENGRRIMKSFTAETAWQAEKAALDYKARYGLGVRQHSMTVEAAINRYIASRDNTASPLTIRTYETIRDSRLRSIMQKKITELTVEDVQNAVNADAASLSAKTIRSAVGLVSAALSFQGVELNLSKRLTFPKYKRKVKILPPCREIFEMIHGTPIELPCLLAMWLSLRISEVRGLRYSDISKDGRWLTVRRAQVYKDGEDILNEYNKTEKSTRAIPLPQELYRMITAQPHESDDDFIVPQGSNLIYKGFKAIMKRNGYDLTFHDLRGVFATTLHNMGVPDDYIQSLGGWSNPTTMYHHYISVLTP